MNQTSKFKEDKEIRIYQSLWKNLLLAIVSLALAVGGVFIIQNDSANFMIKLIAGWLNILFFGVGGLFILYRAIYNRLRHVPLIIIDEDYLEFLEQAKGVYHTVNFADVNGFRLVKEYIAVDYKNVPLMQKFDGSSGLVQKLMRMNFHVTGAIHNIYVDNLTMKGKDICEILNRRLKECKV